MAKAKALGIYSFKRGARYGGKVGVVKKTVKKRNVGLTGLSKRSRSMTSGKTSKLYKGAGIHPHHRRYGFGK